MKFDDENIDLTGVADQRDGRRTSNRSPGGLGAGQVAMAGGLSKMLGGGAGLTLVILLVLAMCSFTGEGSAPPAGMDAGLFQVPGSAQGVSASLAERCPQDAADGTFEDADCLLVKAYNESNEVWLGVFSQAGQELRKPGLTFFDGATRTACGPADTNVGPFYCPGDQRIYFDLGFNRQLEQLGVKGQYALVYIMAHEYGHHLQNSLGIDKRVRRAQQGDRRGPTTTVSRWNCRPTAWPAFGDGWPTTWATCGSARRSSSRPLRLQHRSATTGSWREPESG